MDQKETATPKMSQQKTPSEEESSHEVKNVKGASPTTPTMSSSSTWWGGFISQAKEKVNRNFIQLIITIFFICFTSQHRFFKQ
jgi:hypothetical protein